MRTKDTDPRKDEWVVSRISAEEKQRLRDLSKKEDRSVSYLVRRAVLRELEKAA